MKGFEASVREEAAVQADATTSPHPSSTVELKFSVLRIRHPLVDTGCCGVDDDQDGNIGRTKMTFDNLK